MRRDYRTGFLAASVVCGFALVWLASAGVSLLILWLIFKALWKYVYGGAP